MRSLPLVLLAAVVVACAPRGDDAPATDTASALDSAAATTPIDSARTRRDTTAASASPGIVLPAPQGATPRRDAPVSTRAETSTPPAVPTPRIKPPTRAPGGYIMVPRSAHDSLRMAKPDSTRRP